MSHDTLSDVLRFVRLRGAVFYYISSGRDWAAEAPPAREIALAGEVALSRSALHDRFVQLIGQAPMQYLTQWRMQLAAKLLRESHAPVASIALEVGYDSEAAFSRAFKRVAGKPPATWRKAAEGKPEPPAGKSPSAASTRPKNASTC